MNVLALNCGSSSLKYRIYRWPDQIEVGGGEAVSIGPPEDEPAHIHHRHGGKTIERRVDVPKHASAFEQINKILTESSLTPDVIGHRMVHGGEEFTSHTLVTDDIMRRLKSVEDLAPLHNPPAVKLIESCRQKYPGISQAVIFDTVFHATIPEQAYTYALPQKLRDEAGLRKYGFHGISHEYVVRRATQFLNIDKDHFNAVSCHLGSGGASLCAVRNGQSVDNTMGFSPLQGLIMSTRCGDLDPAAVLYLLDRYDVDPERVENMLNRESGVIGLSGESPDIRDVLQKTQTAGQSEERLENTVESYLWRIRKYLGAYLTVAAPSDAIVFTDTVGESMPEVRSRICADLGAYGVRINIAKNSRSDGSLTDIACENSPVRILVVPTNEELAIASATMQLTSHIAGQN